MNLHDFKGYLLHIGLLVIPHIVSIIGYSLTAICYAWHFMLQTAFLLIFGGGVCVCVGGGGDLHL